MRLGACVFGVVAALALGACAYTPKPAAMNKLPIFPARTPSQSMLNDLPPPAHPIAVAVYGFSDQTGQFKTSSAGQVLSRAVSQGGSSLLVHSLEQAGDRAWFTVVEREQLKDLLNERQIIRDMRAQYLGEKTVNPQALPSLLFAGVLLEGGVVGYDTSTVTGGLGATLLGIGGDAKYQQDTVTVSLRAVSVKTGEVLATVTASKTITSYALDINVFRYVSSDQLLETENGFTTNEPGMLALQEAIDKAVYGLIMEGSDLKLWSFADPAGATPFIERYHAERDGVLTAQQVLAAEMREHPARVLPPTSATSAPTPDAPSTSSPSEPGGKSSGQAAALMVHPDLSAALAPPAAAAPEAPGVLVTSTSSAPGLEPLGEPAASPPVSSR